MPESQQPKPSQDDASCRHRHHSCWRWVLAVAVAVALLVGWAFVSRATAPAAVRARLLSQLQPYFNGVVDVDRAEMRLFRDVRLRNIRASLRGSREPEISTPHLRVDANPWGFLHNDFEVRGVSVVRPLVRINFRPDGSCAFLDLFDTPEWTAPGTRDDERDLVEGVRFDNGVILCRNEGFFGDARPRDLRGLFGWVRRWPSTMSRMDYAIEVREGPWRGVRLGGCFAAEQRWWARIGAECHDLDFSSEALDYLTPAIRRPFSYFDLNGRITGSAALDVARDRPSRHDLRLKLAGGDVRWKRSGVLFEETACDFHLDSEGATVRDISALVWDGMVQGEVKIRFNPAGPARLRAWTEIRDVQISTMMAQFAPGEEPRPGRLSGHIYWSGDLGDPPTAAGQGVLELSDAAVVKLPILAQVFARLKLSLEPSEIIRSGTARIRVEPHNGVVVFERLAVRSANVLVSGRGTVDFDGNVDMQCLAALTPNKEGSSVPILGTVADFVVGGIQRTVMPPVRVHGKLGEPLRTDMVPSFKLRDALLEFFDLVPAPPPKHDKEGRE